MKRFMWDLEIYLFLAFLVVFWLACGTSRPKPEVIHAYVTNCHSVFTRTGDIAYVVTMEFDADGVHHSQNVVMDFANYSRIRGLAEVCLYPTVSGYVPCPCRD